MFQLSFFIRTKQIDFVQGGDVDQCVLSVQKKE